MSTKVAVIGAGYVGLTTGACMAHLGHQVVCADIDADKVEMLRSGRSPIVENGLPELLRAGLRSQRLSFVLGGADAVDGASVVFMCVPTPQGEDGSADLRMLTTAAREIAPYLAPGAIVVNKSTVPVGSARLVAQVLERSDVRVVSNPEFLREGSAVQDFLKPDRVVIGADDRTAALEIAALYDGLAAPLVLTDPESAETIKYAANAFLAMKLTFVNDIATVCERVGADVNDVMVGLGADHRIGSGFLRPGPGWGGSCFPKDTRAMLRIAEDAGFAFPLLEQVIEGNQAQFARMVDKVRHVLGGELSGRRIAVWGLTFKANTDDLRESPSLRIIDLLLAEGATIRAYDPTVSAPRAGLPTTIEIAADPYDACRHADVLIVLTEWDEFRWLEPDKVAEIMTGRAVVDGRNLLDRSDWGLAGFRHLGVGR